MRRDAERNRERLIAVARDFFRARGIDVPLEEIAEKAGVGRSTLFRNFSDRMDLLRAVNAMELAAIAEEELRVRGTPDGIFVLMRTLARYTILYQALTVSLTDAPGGAAEMREAARRAAAVIAEPVARARAAGLLRPDADADMILMACGMIGSVQGATWGRDQETVIDEALALIVQGIAGPASP